MVKVLSHRGFSLIEVIVSIGILGISLLAILPLVINAVQINRSTSIASRAQILAAEKLQELQGWTEDQIQASNCLDTTDWCSDTKLGTQKVYGTSLTRQYRFDSINVSNAPVPQSYLITVAITYTERNRKDTKIFTATWLRP